MAPLSSSKLQRVRSRVTPQLEHQYECGTRYISLRLVDGGTSGTMGLRQASRYGKPTVPLAQRTTRVAVHAF